MNPGGSHIKAGGSGKIFPAAPVFVFLFMAMCLAVLANPGDSSRTKYPITDPRNPDCACHKYQSLAEREYRQLQVKQAGTHISSLQIQVVKNNTAMGGTRKFHFRLSGIPGHNRLKPGNKKKMSWKDLFKRRIDACAEF